MHSDDGLIYSYFLDPHTNKPQVCLIWVNKNLKQARSFAILGYIATMIKCVI
jgi:hypothetical protein